MNEYNDCCFDCGVKLENKWHSINFGVILCIKCAQSHKTLGFKILSIFPLDLNEWKENEVLSLELGGNANAKEYFEKNNFTTKLNEYLSSSMLNLSALMYFREKYVSGLGLGWKQEITARLRRAVAEKEDKAMLSVLSASLSSFDGDDSVPILYSSTFISSSSSSSSNDKRFDSEKHFLNNNNTSVEKEQDIQNNDESALFSLKDNMHSSFSSFSSSLDSFFSSSDDYFNNYNHNNNNNNNNNNTEIKVNDNFIISPFSFSDMNSNNDSEDKKTLPLSLPSSRITSFSDSESQISSPTPTLKSSFTSSNNPQNINNDVLISCSPVLSVTFPSYYPSSDQSSSSSSIEPYTQLNQSSIKSVFSQKLKNSFSSFVAKTKDSLSVIAEF
jgi:hypothetical protein